MQKLLKKLSYVQMIAIGFAVIISVGTALLSLPISSKSGSFTPLIDSFFTATSATCVTGLVVYDTFSHWSVFGKTLIILMIQLGGIGFMTVITLFAMAMKKQIGLSERKLLMQSQGSLQIGGMVSLVRRIALGTLFFEGIGAILLFVRFSRQMSLGKAALFSVFHSVSAFCNAGFDLLGEKTPFSSLTAYSNDYLVNITIMLLIIIGGIGFVVWSDILKNKWHFKSYSLHTKIVLTFSALFVFGGAVLFFIFENSKAFANMPLSEKIIASFFQSVSPRTAGFNTVDLNTLSESGSILTMIFMFVGGCPGSTAGGIKLTTLAVLLTGAFAAARHNPNIVLFKRRLDDGIVKEASAIFTIYMSVSLICAMTILALESFSLKQVFFEVFSAIGTVGLTLGITPSLGAASKIIITLLMFLGRVGGLTLALVLAQKRTAEPVNRPAEKILIG